MHQCDVTKYIGLETRERTEICAANLSYFLLSCPINYLMTPHICLVTV